MGVIGWRLEARWRSSWPARWPADSSTGSRLRHRPDGPAAVAAGGGAAGGGPARVGGSVVGHVSTLPAIWHAIDWRRLAPMLVGRPDRRAGRQLDAAVDRPRRIQADRRLVLIAYCTFMLVAAGRVRLAAGGRGAEAVIGLAGGVLGGLAGLSGVLPTVWAALKGWPKEERRIVFQAFNMTILSAMLVATVVQGLIGMRLLVDCRPGWRSAGRSIRPASGCRLSVLGALAPRWERH